MALVSGFSRTRGGPPEGGHYVETRRAFDLVAATYDRSNAGNPLLCAMRARVRRRVESFVWPGSHMLDLGCGPGADAEYFARLGYRVTAVDWSQAMVAEARRRIRDAGLAGRVDVYSVGIHELSQLEPQAFDAAYSNFGPLNCVADLPAAARLIADRLRPQGLLIASVIGRVCPWEIAVYLARREWSRAAIRFRREPVPVPLENGTIWTRYFAPAEFERAFADAGFARVSLRALGLFAPPPYLQAFADRHPSLTRALRRTDDAVGGWPGLRSWGDHFLIALRKVR